MNTSLHQTSPSSQGLIIQRQPPAVPISPPQVTKPLPALPTKTSPDSSSSNPDRVSPPQPPQRVRSLNKPATFDHSPAQKTFVKSSHNLLENASNEAAKLVYKTVMMGSVQNINSGLDSDNSPPKPGERRNRKLSVSFFVLSY